MPQPDGLLSERFFDALRFAAELHNQQVRKGAEVPYISHLLGVSSLVLEHGGSEDEAIAALLHDAIEDQAQHNGGPEALGAKIRDRFGDRVVTIVSACTDADAVPKAPWRERKERYLKHVAQTLDPGYHRVTIADKLHNARAILLDYRIHGDALWERFHGKEPAEHLWYYRGLVDAFRAAGLAPKALIDELDRVVSELEALVSGGI
jgi:(p)ppGpp synthase/HD superfamily hydrolase